MSEPAHLQDPVPVRQVLTEPGEVHDLVAEMACRALLADMDEAAGRIAAQAPPFSEQTRARLAELLRAGAPAVQPPCS